MLRFTKSNVAGKNWEIWCHCFTRFFYINGMFFVLATLACGWLVTPGSVVKGVTIAEGNRCIHFICLLLLIEWCNQAAIPLFVRPIQKVVHVRGRNPDNIKLLTCIWNAWIISDNKSQITNYSIYLCSQCKPLFFVVGSLIGLYMLPFSF